MTVQLYLQQATYLNDIKVLKTVIDAGHPDLVEPLSKFMNPINISSNPFTVGNITINVSLEELALIGIFNGGL